MNSDIVIQRANRLAPHRTSRLRHQRGAILVFALIVLVAMTLAGVAMIRSVDTSVMIAGNLVFKQSATTSGDAGVEAAIAWLVANGGSLEQDSASNGYYATSQDCLDLTGNATSENPPSKKCAPPFTVLDWSNTNAVTTLAKDAVGNEVAYVIHRMCSNTGPLVKKSVNNECATEEEESTTEGLSRGSGRPMVTYQSSSWGGEGAGANRGYYRITARITGPRNNTSYVQVVISK